MPKCSLVPILLSFVYMYVIILHNMSILSTFKSQFADAYWFVGVPILYFWIFSYSRFQKYPFSRKLILLFVLNFWFNKIRLALMIFRHTSLFSKQIGAARPLLRHLSSLLVWLKRGNFANFYNRNISLLKWFLIFL